MFMSFKLFISMLYLFINIKKLGNINYTELISKTISVYFCTIM